MDRTVRIDTEIAFTFPTLEGWSFAEEHMSSASRVFRNLRRRRRLLVSQAATSLRLHGTSENHPDDSTRLPAHHSDTAGEAIDGTPTPCHRDASSSSSYAAMVAAHLGRDLPRAEALYRAAPEAARGPALDAVMLAGYAKAGRVHRARRLFDGMLTRGVVAWTCMVDAYCRAGRVSEARELFDAMPERSVVSWTAMMHGYARAGMPREAREMFDRMPERNVVSWTVMVKAYADGGYFQDAMGLFDRMPQRNSYSWNAVISGSFRAGRVDEAVRLFERMPHRNVVSWTAMVTGLAQNGRVSMAREFFDVMPCKDITAWNAMITAYANNGEMNEARRLFDSMPAKDLVSWNTVIDGYAKKELKDEASGLFLDMLRSAASPNSTTLISVLVISESMVEVVQIHGLATTLGLLSETSLGNALLTMYSRIGDLPSAWLAFKRLEEKDAITWTSMIQAFANHGHASYALQAFAQMLEHGKNPSSTTFTAVLSACSHAGLVEEGKSVFRSIRHVYGLERTIEHYTCLIDILGRAGNMREAMDVVNAMPPDICDDAILRTLLGACMMHKEVDAAREVGEVLAKSDPSGSGGYYMVLANVLASGGLWDEMADVWKAMKGSNVRKTPGVSQITVDARNHAFFSRDQIHPQCAEIYEMLDHTLVPEMKKIVETVCQTCN
ncbi:pentatricopeptide repeat-containing protein At2g35030, mitochondrial-like [Brachypodium distachyon]|uniref:Pentacotripeptide-repeat region of PRORP domain-containing protein n=1 Tax=Brachypodium distachyon TaxID=15368 RepID=I1GKT2_BRADI|nr:pentatricopeptide repeat-containing protein At2g35030, mitochondrial-like [Brachypodium distachyon]KQK12076.2 hypothetical protein BRADI_1g01470v3 [Brachypodium distachyon]|eukprot:XP_024313840.1 pentatricopeptide repeat-containing protein At2g35030, mitochondrial-like [Brachypodium distachyon]